MTKILSLATVLFSLSPEVCIDWTFLAWFQNDTEDLFARPQSHGLKGTEHSEMLAAGHNRAMQQAQHSKKYLYDSWAGERDPDFLIFAHKN